MKLLGVPKKIEKIEFALLSPKEIREMATAKIITADTYDDDGFPVDMGLMDPRLGVIEPGLKCKTCGGRVDQCPGHFGYIDLAMPVIHVGYVKLIKHILESTCRACGALLISKELARKREVTLEESDEAGETKSLPRVTCHKCGEPQGKITLDKPTTFREDGHKLTPKEIRERLERVGNPELGNPEEDLEALGFGQKVTRPEWMVLTALPVPPVCMRPSITLESGERSEDDLTHKLVDVLRINQRLQENKDAGAPQLIVEDLWELLHYHITTYFDNQTPGIPPARHRSGRALKTLAQRLKGKEGRFRSNLSGKRVNFSARTVISPDPNLSMNEVGVPLEIAKELTVPVTVMPYNIQTLKELVARGPSYPSANYIIRPDGRRLKITEKNAKELAEKLEINYVVERHLVDGDIVLFNRQPSLHRMSMMAHYVKVMPYKTFRLNLAVCPPYNADFDGDEMNLHVPQSEEAKAEAKMLMLVQEHILSPRFGGSVIGCIHDHVTGMFLLTHKDAKFSKKEVAKLLAAIDYRGELPKRVEKNYWLGKDIFSLLLPQDLNLEYRASICQMCEECKKEKCKYDAYVIIKKGKLLQGTIDGRSIGAFKGKLLDKIVRDYGTEQGRNIIDLITRLAIATISLRGFTTGIDDEDIPQEAGAQIVEVLKEAKAKSEKLVTAYKEGSLEQLPGRSLEETLEVEVMKVLGRARDDAGKIASQYLGLDNPSVIMAVSGARGSILNLSQMAGCIGQQAVRGERIHRGYGARTLPHFEKGALGPEARGFVNSSYKSGLTPAEFFFHCMGGREGLVDTAVRTSRSGYMQRRLINALEDVKVKYDGTVRNTANTIIQFNYGEDKVDPARSVRGRSIDIDDILKELVGVAVKEEPPEKMKVVGEEEMGLPAELEEEIIEEEAEEVEVEVSD
ncbi:MAG: DNA-directed RNA polymerase subunit A' [Candidatus Thermoplasmatota archaeon]|nr:DNA-directed RNA polymerase subunit A' [Candidatus Thermoplasmatota archaeon]